MTVADVEHSGLIGLDFRIKGPAFRAHCVHQKLNSS
jgi:hypothetical protein